MDAVLELTEGKDRRTGMKLICTILFAFAFTASAQIQPNVMQHLLSASIKSSQPFTAPTNEPYNGSKVISWWLSSDYATNAGVPTLADRGGVNAYNFTNLGAASTRPYTFNNHLRFYYPDGTYLKAANYSSTQPHEVVLVATYLMVSNYNADAPFFDGMVAGRRNFLRHGSGTIGFGYYAGTVQSFMPDLTNQCIMFSVAFNGANSYVFTNKVLATTANPGTQNMDQGMTLGIGSAGGPTSLEFYEMVTYSATNSPEARSNLYYYFKTIKGYALP